MNTVIITEVKVYKINESYYTNESFFYILKRYKNAFGKVKLLTRVVVDNNIPKGYVNISKVCDEIYNSESIIKVLINNKNSIIKEIIKGNDLIILRVPSIISIKCYKYIKKYKKIYMTEVMGCAWDDYWNHSFLSKILAVYGFVNMKKIVKNANYSVYVTENFLQRRYPCNNKTLSASNVMISDYGEDVLQDKIKNIKRNNKSKEVLLMTSAAVDVKYKGQEYVIKAIPKLLKEGYDVKYYLAGGGSQTRLKKIAQKYRVENNVIFLGRLSRDDVFKYLDKIDIYIQPSLQEGLPRALIEAMSRACMSIGTMTAGIPELLKNDFLVRTKNKNDIYEKIKMIINSSEAKKVEISKINFDKSKCYLEEVLNNKRKRFYDDIKNDFEFYN